jgi:hypothetical protein
LRRGARRIGVHGLTVATLSRELSDFLVELSITLNKHTIYPPGHPLLGVAIDGVEHRLQLLFTGERESLSLGVARKQLIIEGVATDPENPVLKELAQRLHKHHVGAVRFQRGISRDELADALAALSVDATRSEKPIGLDRDAAAARWQHVHFFPLTYDRLQLIEDDPTGEAPRPDQMAASRSTQLWIGLARAALVTDTSSPSATPEQDESTAFEPATVARAIDEHQREQAYDQVIVGYLLQIGDELKTAEGPEAAGLQRRVSRLVGSLKPATLERLLEMGGDKAQRRKFLLDASQGISVEAVVDLVKAASQAEGQTVSHSMLRMLGKLANHPTSRKTPRQRANPMVRDVMKRLVDDWSLDDPNPLAYRAALESFVKVGGGSSEQQRTTAVTECEPERLIKIGIEVGAFGPQVRAAMNTLRNERRYDTLLNLVEQAPSAEAGAPVATFLKEQKIFDELLASERVDFTLAGRFARRIGSAAAPAILDALVRIDDSKLRVHYYDLLESLGEEIATEVAVRLPASPPQVQRELLALLGRLPTLPEGFSARPYLRHAEPVVRREAVRLLLRDPAARETTILSALSDPDNRVAFAGLAAAQESCPPPCRDLIKKRVDRGELDAQLRTMGIRIVARQRTPATLQWLLGFVVIEARWPLRPRLRPATPEMLSALGEIAAGWSGDPDAGTVLNLAQHSKDPEVRAKLVRGRPRETPGGDAGRE